MAKKGFWKNMTKLDVVSTILVIVGALNWLLVGVFKQGIVSLIFGELSIVSRLVYILVGLAGIYSVGRFADLSSK